jgi:hypothetical protein
MPAATEKSRTEPARLGVFKQGGVKQGGWRATRSNPVKDYNIHKYR